VVGYLREGMAVRATGQHSRSMDCPRELSLFQKTPMLLLYCQIPLCYKGLNTHQDALEFDWSVVLVHSLLSKPKPYAGHSRKLWPNTKSYKGPNTNPEWR
jgi:hypothetical protein